ncbi:MAG: c(7)-type cytochrome triheme domain-containing protein [Gemmatimonadota bacterium]
MGRRSGIAALSLLAALPIAGCGKAAGVFFDVPPKAETPETGTSPAAPTVGARSAPGGPLRADTVPEARPAIESVRDPDSVLALLPRDNAGDVDWVAALRTGVIAPRRARPGETAPPPSGFGYDFIIRGPAPMFDASFPHSRHIEWLACESCHPRIFPYRGDTITMAAINAGEKCGRCHGRVAFGPAACERCHTGVTMAPNRIEATLGGSFALARTAEAAARTPQTAFPPARFPHWVHRIRYRCSACHTEPFEMRAGSSELTMAEMQRGQACGTCHDGRSAFGLVECQRCHVATETGGPADR